MSDSVGVWAILDNVSTPVVTEGFIIDGAPNFLARARGTGTYSCIVDVYGNSNKIEKNGFLLYSFTLSNTTPVLAHGFIEKWACGYAELRNITGNVTGVDLALMA